MNTPPSHTQLDQPVFKRDGDVDDLAELLHDSLNNLYPESTRELADPSEPLNTRRIKYHALLSAIGKFQRYLSSLPSPCLQMVNEGLLDQFWQYLTDQGEPSTNIEPIIGGIRKLINLTPAKHRHRKLLSPRQVKQLNLHHGLSPSTQLLFRDFLSNGVSVELQNGKYSLTHDPLSTALRIRLVQSARTVLKRANLNDISKFTKAHADQVVKHYSTEKTRRAGLNLLGYLKPLFRYAVAVGTLKEFPLDHIPKREDGRRTDYVTLESIDVIRKYIATLPLKNPQPHDFLPIRNALLMFGCHYDFALRNRESTLLDILDITPGAPYMALKIRGEIQKWGENGGKDDVIFENIFPETRELMIAYTALRQRFFPKIPALFINERGQRLTTSGSEFAVRGLAKQLGITTFEGKSISPHILRHTFGTLNIQPLGFFPLEMVSKRLRHNSIAFTYARYVQKNPLLDHDRHHEVVSRMNGSSPHAMLSPSTPPKDFIEERAALRLLRNASIHVTPKALRKISGELKQSSRPDSRHLYSESWVKEVATEYCTRDEAMDTLHMKGRSSILYWAKTAGAKTLVIGKVSLIERLPVNQERERRRFKKRA